MWVILSLLMFSLMWAHDFWIEKGEKGFRIRYGHFLKDSLAYDPNKFVSIKCLNRELKEIPFEKVVDAEGLVIRGDCALLIAKYVAGYFSLTPDGEVNRPKDEVKNAVKSWKAVSYIKFVNEYTEKLKEPIGQRLEILLLSDPFAKKPGDKVSLRVLLDRVPKEGVPVSSNDRYLGKTREGGFTRVRIREGKVQVISASYELPLESPKADYLVLESFLSFEVRR